MAFKEGMRKASPVLLEPMMAVEVETPEEYAGPVMGGQMNLAVNHQSARKMKH